MSTIPIEAIEAAVIKTLGEKPKKKRSGNPHPRTDKLIPYVKGQSGNPKGRPPKPKPLADIPDAFRAVLEAPEAKLLIAKAVLSAAQDVNHPALIKAAQLLLDRTVGPVTQKTEHSGSIGIHRIEFVGLTPDKAERIAELFSPRMATEPKEPEEDQTTDVDEQTTDDEGDD